MVDLELRLKPIVSPGWKKIDDYTLHTEMIVSHQILKLKFSFLGTLSLKTTV